MDVFRLLKQDHKEVRALFKKLQAARAAKARAKGLQQLQEALTLHIEAEEQIVYPWLRDQKRFRRTIGEAYEEHHVATNLLQELTQTPVEEERWGSKLTVLKEIVEHHVQEEEKELFPEAGRAFAKDEVKAIGQRVEEWKTRRMADMKKKAKRVAPARIEGETYEEQRPHA